MHSTPPLLVILTPIVVSSGSILGVHFMPIAKLPYQGSRVNMAHRHLVSLSDIDSVTSTLFLKSSSDLVNQAGISVSLGSLFFAILISCKSIGDQRS